MLGVVCIFAVMPPRSMTQRFYGSGVNADALANTTIGGPFHNTTSYGFLLNHSGILSSVRLYVMWSKTRSGYSGGTGGSLLVSLQTDDGSAEHYPSGKTLASAFHTDPMSKGNFPLLTFQSSVRVIQGQICHIVITNPDPDPVSNYVSVNSLWMRYGLHPKQPTIADRDWFQLLGNATKPGWWVPRENSHSESYTPILQLDYADGYSTGIGYMEVWVGNPKTISGRAAVRQTFKVNGPDRKISRVAVRLRRVYGSAPLSIRLEKADGTLLETGMVDAAKIDMKYCWVNYSFSSTQTLLNGKRYNLSLRTLTRTAYETFPIRKGSAANVRFSTSTYFADGFAQFTNNGTWSGWDQWGEKNRQDADLQFVFVGSN